MKKRMMVIIVALCALTVSTASFANMDRYKDNLKEGSTLVANSPKIFAESVTDEFNASTFKPFGVVGGLMKGTFYGLKELGTGIFRILTFNIELW